MIVADASVVADLVLGTGNEGGTVVLANLDVGVAVPHLVDLEVTSVVRRLHLAGAVPLALADAALATLVALPLHRHAHVPLVARAFELHRNASPYDAAYLALAELLGVPFVTGDARLAAVPGCTAAVEVVAVG